LGGVGDAHPLPPASQGGSATRNAKRLRRSFLRLRCAPPSKTSVAIRARASESGGREPQVRPAASRERSCISRSPLRRLPLVQSAPERAKAAVANRRFAPPPVASAHAPTHLSPLGFTPRGAGQSERERAPEAKLQQPASRERSNHGQISSISAHFFVARASS
jgi:hypothetical protein